MVKDVDANQVDQTSIRALTCYWWCQGRMAMDQIHNRAWEKRKQSSQPITWLVQKPGL